MCKTGPETGSRILLLVIHQRGNHDLPLSHVGAERGLRREKHLTPGRRVRPYGKAGGPLPSAERERRDDRAGRWLRVPGFNRIAATAPGRRWLLRAVLHPQLSLHPQRLESRPWRARIRSRGCRWRLPAPNTQTQRCAWRFPAGGWGRCPPHRLCVEGRRERRV